MIRTMGVGLVILLSVTVTVSGAGQPSQTSTDAPLGSNPYALYLQAGVIDLTNADSSLKGDLSATFDPNAYYVIQLDGPMTPARRTDIEASGLVLRDYLPMNAYVVRGNSIDSAGLGDLDFIRWVGQFEDDWKLSPSLANEPAFETPERQLLAAQGRRLLALSLFAGADMVEALREIDALSIEVVNVQPMGERLTIEVEVATEQIDSLKRLRNVLFVSEVPEGVPRNASTSWIAQSNIENFRPLWDAGLHGEDQIVNLIDWALDAAHCAFSDAVPPGPSHRKLLSYVSTPPLSFGYHGTHVGGILAGDEIADTTPNLKGMAYESKIVFQHYVNLFVNSSLFERLEFARDLGAHVHSNSWGSSNDSSYNVWCENIDRFTNENEDELVVVAILNGASSSAPMTILSPENAKNCLATAASRDTPEQHLHGSGARGPTNDGRQKPEVWIPGCNDSANIGTVCGVLNRACATSWSAPAVSGMALLTRQYFLNGFYPSGAATPADSLMPSGALVKAIIVNSATDMSGFAGYFGTHEGYGRVVMDDALFFASDARRLIVHDVRHADGLSTEESQSYDVDVLSNLQMLKVTLVWSDVEAAVASVFAPVNNLDLIVTDPIGNVYHGNAFTGIESNTTGPADAINNTEQVQLSAPMPGIWQVTVSGTAVNVGTQGYALVITGDVEESVTCLKGDLNDDSDVDGEDVGGFVNVLLNSGTPRELCAADMDESGSVDNADIDPFVSLLLGI